MSVQSGVDTQGKRGWLTLGRGKVWPDAVLAPGLDGVLVAADLPRAALLPVHGIVGVVVTTVQNAVDGLVALVLVERAGAVGELHSKVNLIQRVFVVPLGEGPIGRVVGHADGVAEVRRGRVRGVRADVVPGVVVGKTRQAVCHAPRSRDAEDVGASLAHRINCKRGNDLVAVLVWMEDLADAVREEIADDVLQDARRAGGCCEATFVVHHRVCGNICRLASLDELHLCLDLVWGCHLKRHVAADLEGTSWVIAQVDGGGVKLEEGEIPVARILRLGACPLFAEPALRHVHPVAPVGQNHFRIDPASGLGGLLDLSVGAANKLVECFAMVRREFESAQRPSPVLRLTGTGTGVEEFAVQNDYNDSVLVHFVIKFLE